jgi:CheY-like chemotaxis protein
MACILVVDDELGIRALLSEILTDEGHTVDVAENAAQARAARDRARPDLVLLDMHLGDMTGLELLQQMRTHASLAALPSMVLSADALPESQRQAAKAGVLEYLTKPIDVPKFLAAMDAVQSRL